MERIAVNDMVNITKYTSKKLLALLVCTGISVSMIAGCGSEGSAGDSSAANTENVEDAENSTNQSEELIDPVVGIPATATAEYRTLYDVDVYTGVVNPQVTEYTYETAEPFGKYGKVPGEEVAAGDILIYGDTEELDEKTRELEEQAEKIDKEYTKNSGDLKQDLAQSQKLEAETGTVSNSIDEEYRPLFIEGPYKEANLNSRRIKNQMELLDKNYAIDKEHITNLMGIIEDDIRDVVVTSDTSGVLVAEGEHQVGETIAQGTKIAAVAELGIKKFDTEFVNSGDLKKAVDIYAIADGKRYDVTPVIIESKEYQQKKKLNGTVYSSFILPEDCDLEYGAYGVVVVEKDVRQDVLCVPLDAITNENGTSYVNIYNDGEIDKTEIKTGMKDGMYIEVLSGLEAGVKVLSDSTPEKGKTVKTLEKGSVTNKFEQTGYMYSSSMEWIKNPAEMGTCYLTEMCVDDYEQVTQGQVVAKVEVIPDNVEIARLNRQVQRETERLNDLNEEASKDYTGKVNLTRDRAIRQRKDNIEELNKQISKLSKYSGVIELKAPFTGMVVFRTDIKAGDLIRTKQNILLLCDYSHCFISVDDTEGRLGYGKSVNVTYTDTNSSKQTVQGTVVTANMTAVSSDLMTKNPLIALGEEDTQVLIQQASGKADAGWFRTRFTIETQVNNMENVVLVPRAAVIEKGGDRFVRVLTDDGVKYVGFVSGGADLSNYWVVEGLTEGMQICYD